MPSRTGIVLLAPLLITAAIVIGDYSDTAAHWVGAGATDLGAMTLIVRWRAFFSGTVTTRSPVCGTMGCPLVTKRAARP